MLPLLLLLSACAIQQEINITTHPLTEMTYPPSEQVAILSTGTERPYVKLAMLETECQGAVGQEQVLAQMREAARRIGADAIIPQRAATLDEDADSVWLCDYQTFTGGLTGILRAFAIKFKD